jgi:hypothetical protein
MTASLGREVDANLLLGAALGSAQARASPHDARRQDLPDFVEAFGRSHSMEVDGSGHGVRVLSMAQIYLSTEDHRTFKPLHR